MNRRTALKFSMLLGGLAAPGRLWAQSRTKRASNSTKPSRFEDDGADVEIGSPSQGGGRAGVVENSTDDFTREPGFQWKNYDISAYTKVAARSSSKLVDPQKAVVDWAFRRTSSDVWHGEKRAVLCASKTRLRVYNSPDVIKQVDEVVERFTNAVEDVLTVRVQFVAAVDTRWRYAVYSHLTPVGGGPQGQQIWTMRMEDAALVISNMSVQQGFRKIFDRTLSMVNGQTLKIRSSEDRTYSGGIQREGAAGLGFQPKAEKLTEGVTLRLSPLLTFDGDAVDAAVDLSVNTVRAFHRTKVLAPREIGPSEISVDVPEAALTHLDQTIKNWPLGQTIVISAGIHPGILAKKGGLWGLPIPGTYPTGTEVLVFLDVELGSRSRNSPSPREPNRDDVEIEDSPRDDPRKLDGGAESIGGRKSSRDNDF